ncbi:hypothetical protein [Catenisphaera adipataccumulans]|jgi:hypothetical protein|uniref:Uncharacterized protein n=1 Tax=Catenisphaera adipataccumulans TaxID=700500 RepID=A0A7W8CV17_9FIRM|nr:hypothetical protein [Catenisphaera adipataccumulans]MBB5182083.1 hypothetical protein [Catenisphaera adipataccumulans]
MDNIEQAASKMTTAQTVCKYINKITIFLTIAVAIIILAIDPTIYLTQTWTLIHWVGLAMIVIIVSSKISAYIGVLKNPHHNIIFIVLQLIFVPIITNFLINYFHLPVLVASSIAFATLTPGGFGKNFAYNILLSVCMLFISWYVLPSSSTAVNEVYTASTSTTARIVVAILGLIALAVYEYFDWKRKMRDKNEPLEVYYFKEK